MTFAILYGSDPWLRADGGTMRVRALHAALEPFGARVLFPGSLATALPVGSHRKAVKQRYFPLPMRRSEMLTDMTEQLERLDPRCVLSASHALTPAAFTRAASEVWVDHFDLWSDFGRREAAQRHGLARLTSLAQARLWERRELSERERYRVATAASYDDATRLRDAVWMPTPVPLVASGIRKPVGRRAGFLANFAYWPNRDAFDLLVNVWLPVLRSQGWSVVVAGYDADSLAAPGGLENLGTIGDVSEFYDSIDITLAPMRLGGGMKVKVVESLAHGRPVLASPHAVDGLPPELLKHLLVAEEPPIDLEAALLSLDHTLPLSKSLEAFQPSTFASTARGLAELLLSAAV